MRKNKNTARILAAAVIAVVIFLILGIRLSGHAVKLSEVSIIRLVEKNETENLTIVRIAVISDKVMLIKENLSGNCNMIEYYVRPEVDIIEFSEKAAEWILANRSSYITEIGYSVPYKCTISRGEYYALESLAEKDSGSPKLQSIEITEAKSKKEFERMMGRYSKNSLITVITESDEWFTWAIIIICVLIAGFLIILALKSKR